MSRFATARHVLARAGLCPGQNESAGKKKSSRLRKGAPWLKSAMAQAKWSAVRKKDSYDRAQFHRLKARGGPKTAIWAAASMLTAIYHRLKDGVQHHDLGANHFDQRSTNLKAKRLVAQLARLGFEVAIHPLEKAA